MEVLNKIPMDSHDHDGGDNEEPGSTSLKKRKRSRLEWEEDDLNRLVELIKGDVIEAPFIGRCKIPENDPRVDYLIQKGHGVDQIKQKIKNESRKQASELFKIRKEKSKTELQFRSGRSEGHSIVDRNTTWPTEDVDQLARCIQENRIKAPQQRKYKYDADHADVHALLSKYPRKVITQKIIEDSKDNSSVIAKARFHQWGRFGTGRNLLPLARRKSCAVSDRSKSEAKGMAGSCENTASVCSIAPSAFYTKWLLPSATGNEMSMIDPKNPFRRYFN
jgi:hypothetical protein